MTQARSPALYASGGVPDSLQGRFEMIVLHVALLLRRLAGEGEAGRALGQALTETFVVDLDDNMRELTFSDLRVPKEVKRATAALFDRHTAYLAALSSPHDAALADALTAQLAYLGLGPHFDAQALARYARACGDSLARISAAELFSGRLAWPQHETGVRTQDHRP